MRSACLVRTRFILNNYNGIGLGGPRSPRTPHWLRPWNALVRLFVRRSCFADDCSQCLKTGKGSQYSITERWVPELISVLGSQPAGDVSHKPGGRLPLLSARPAVTPTTLKRAATNFAAS